jgi:hypothetical protein
MDEDVCPQFLGQVRAHLTVFSDRDDVFASLYLRRDLVG